MLQLALCLLIHPFVFSVEIFYEHTFSLLSKWATGAVDLFYNGYCHITDTDSLKWAPVVLVRILFLT